MQEQESKTKWHFTISIMKSIIRIGAGISLILNTPYNIQLAGGLLILAEILGIVEEL